MAATDFDSDGDPILSYHWTSIWALGLFVGPGSSYYGYANGKIVQVQIPNVDAPRDISIQLTVNDGKFNSNPPDTVVHPCLTCGSIISSYTNVAGKIARPPSDLMMLAKIKEGNINYNGEYVNCNWINFRYWLSSSTNSFVTFWCILDKIPSAIWLLPTFSTQTYRIVFSDFSLDFPNENFTLLHQ